MRPRLTLIPVILVLAACSGPGAGSAGPASPPPASSETTASAGPPSPSAATGPSAAASAAPGAPGERRTDPSGAAQVWVPAGTFQMGTDAATIEALAAEGPPEWVVDAFPSEQPQHEVTLSNGFWIDVHEVTNAAYDAFVAAGGYTTEAFWSDGGWKWLSHRDVASLPAPCEGTSPEHPRRCVSWWEAEAFATWRGGRLPTEAEWEFAARGPDSRTYPWGDTFDPELANVVDSTGPTPVGSFPDGASWVGALDMAGNAMEWVADWLDAGYYADSPAVDPPGPDGGRNKVEKGGWWGSNPFVARAAYRHYEDPPNYADEHIGFRVVTP